jgi:hypothetical protein
LGGIGVGVIVGSKVAVGITVFVGGTSGVEVFSATAVGVVVAAGAQAATMSMAIKNVNIFEMIFMPLLL